MSAGMESVCKWPSPEMSVQVRPAIFKSLGYELLHNYCTVKSALHS